MYLQKILCDMGYPMTTRDDYVCSQAAGMPCFSCVVQVIRVDVETDTRERDWTCEVAWIFLAVCLPLEERKMMLGRHGCVSTKCQGIGSHIPVVTRSVMLAEHLVFFHLRAYCENNWGYLYRFQSRVFWMEGA